MTSLLAKIQAALRALRERPEGTESQTRPPRASGSGEPPLTAMQAQRLKALAEMVAITDEAEVDCDAAFALVDQYAELVMQGKPAADLLPRVRQHLELCLPCREEYQALLAILQAEHS